MASDTTESEHDLSDDFELNNDEGTEPEHGLHEETSCLSARPSSYDIWTFTHKPAT